MKQLKYTLLLTILINSVFSFAATNSTKKTTAADISRDVEQMYKKVFAEKNLVASNFSRDLYEPWFYVLTTLSEWINQLLLVERSLGSRISASNKEAIQNGTAAIKKLSEKLVSTIGSLHALVERSKQFNPPSEIFKFAQEDIRELNNAYSLTSTTRKSLGLGLLDVRDTIDIKNILGKIFSLLSGTITKISDDVKELDKKGAEEASKKIKEELDAQRKKTAQKAEEENKKRTLEEQKKLELQTKLEEEKRRITELKKIEEQKRLAEEKLKEERQRQGELEEKARFERDKKIVEEEKKAQDKIYLEEQQKSDLEIKKMNEYIEEERAKSDFINKKVKEAGVIDVLFGTSLTKNAEQEWERTGKSEWKKSK